MHEVGYPDEEAMDKVDPSKAFAYGVLCGCASMVVNESLDRMMERAGGK
jgi:hypothetical protein